LSIPVDLHSFQAQIGVRFENDILLLHALTHPSFQNENPHLADEDNQRLEFLGDAVLDFVAGELLYQRFPKQAEGRLTRLRAAMVRTETLAQLARNCGIGESLLLGRGEEENKGRQRDSNLCAAFEAVCGALYLDRGMDAAKEFVLPMFEKTLSTLLEKEVDKDPKSRLQEWSQQHLGITPVYKMVGSSGPDHAKIFTIAVYINDEPRGEGTGRSKRLAAQEAAKRVLETLEEILNE